MVTLDPIAEERYKKSRPKRISVHCIVPSYFYTERGKWPAETRKYQNRAKTISGFTARHFCICAKINGLFFWFRIGLKQGHKHRPTACLCTVHRSNYLYVNTRPSTIYNVVARVSCTCVYRYLLVNAAKLAECPKSNINSPPATSIRQRSGHDLTDSRLCDVTNSNTPCTAVSAGSIMSARLSLLSTDTTRKLSRC